jgi:GGDEF domain-containing protein
VHAALHPYLLVTLLIATRYGTVDGLVSGVIGAVLVLLFRFESAPALFESSAVLMDLNVMATPYLLILVGTVLGEVRQVAEDEIQTLWYRVRKARSSLSHLNHEATAVRTYNEKLQERIASSTETTGAFYEAAAAAQSLQEPEVLTAILDIVHRFLGAEQSAIYVATKTRWDLSLQRGWRSPEEYPNHLPTSDPLFAEAAKGSTISVAETEIASNSQCMLVAPLMIGDDNDVLYGAIAIQQMPLTAISHATLRNLEGISEWGSHLLTATNQFKKVQERDPVDQVTGIYRYNYLLARLENESLRWRRYHTPCTLLLMEIVHYERVPARKRAAFLRRIGTMLQSHARSVDLVARWTTPHWFGMLLPSTNSQGARRLAARLSDFFHREILPDVPHGADLSLRFGCGTAGESGDRALDLIQAAEQLEIH